jgi:hypothetical protein
MPNPVIPIAQVQKFTPHQSGDVYDFGHCFTERPSEQLANPEYTFLNLVLEANTNSLLTKPKITVNTTNDTTQWTPSGTQWALAYPSGYPSGRTLMKWTKADATTEYSLVGKVVYPKGEPIVWEVGLLPSPLASTIPVVDLLWGNQTAKLTLTKNRSPVFSVKVGSTWKEISEVPLNFKMLWKDNITELIYIMPLFGGVLFSTDGTDWLFVRPPGGLDIQGGVLSVEGKGGVAVYGGHTVTFESASITSAVIEMGTVPTKDPNILLFGDLNGGSYVAAKAPVDDTSYRYGIELIPGTKPMAITKISVNHPPDVRETPALALTVNDVETVNEQIPEDPLTETCTIKLLNQNYQYTGAFKRFDVMSWYFGWWYSDNTKPLTLRNTGIVQGINDTRDSEGEKYIELTLKSPIQKVKDNTVIYAPDYSGWDVGDALSDSLLRCGVPTGKQSIYDWGITLPDVQEQGVWQPQFGEPWWKWFEEVVYHILGGWIVTRRDGSIRIEPYPEVEDQTWSGAFLITPAQLEEFNFSQPPESVNEVRNIIVVQGLSPDGYPLAAVLRDEGSLHDPLAPNYVGYPKPLVFRSSSLCTQEIVDYTCTSLYQKFRKMRNTVEFTTNTRSGSPDLYPGALVTVDGLCSLIVRSVSSVLSHGEFSQTVYGHYIEV